MTEPPSRKDNLPEAPDIDDDLDIAQVGVPNGGGAYASAGPDLALAAATIEAAAPMRRTGAAGNAAPIPTPTPPPRRTAASGQGASGPLALHAPAIEPPPPAPARGRMREDGVFAPEGQPADFDLPTSRFTR
jgi:hypothetical protein